MDQKHGMKLFSCQRQMTIKAFYFSKIKIQNLVEESLITANFLDVSEGSVYKIRKQKLEGPLVTASKKFLKKRQTDTYLWS